MSVFFYSINKLRAIYNRLKEHLLDLPKAITITFSRREAVATNPMTIIDLQVTYIPGLPAESTSPKKTTKRRKKKKNDQMTNLGRENGHRGSTSSESEVCLERVHWWTLIL